MAPCRQLAPKDRNYCDVTLVYSLLWVKFGISLGQVMRELYGNIFNKAAVCIIWIMTIYWNHLLIDTTETETRVAEKSSWDQANRREKLGLVWRNRKKICNDYLCLPFFLLIILCSISIRSGILGEHFVAEFYSDEANAEVLPIAVLLLPGVAIL